MIRIIYAETNTDGHVTWNESFHFVMGGLESHENLHLELVDDEKLSVDQFIGHVTIYHGKHPQNPEFEESDFVRGRDYHEHKENDKDAKYFLPTAFDKPVSYELELLDLENLICGRVLITILLTQGRIDDDSEENDKDDTANQEIAGANGATDVYGDDNTTEEQQLLHSHQ